MRYNGHGKWIFLVSWFFIFFAAESYAAKTPISEYDNTSDKIRVRVRLLEAAKQVLVRGFDLRFKEEGGRLAFRAGGLSEWQLTCQNGVVRAISTTGQKWIDLRGQAVINSLAGFISFQNRPYREFLHVYPLGGRCEIINEVDIEKYLDGLVNAEFSARWSEEAIAAQIIAARTYALYKIRLARRVPASHFDLDSTIKDQVYDGSIREDFRASRSADRTQGMVLMTRSAGAWVPMQAFYHSTCGGQPELPEQVWGGRYLGFTKTVACPYCAVSPVFRWMFDVDVREHTQVIRQGILSDGDNRNRPLDWRNTIARGELVNIRVLRNQTGQLGNEDRVYRVLTSWRLGKLQVVDVPVSAVRFRGWLGVAKVRSTLFDISPATRLGRWRITGRGNGHGVGLCQWGAKRMGEKGFSAASILKHYYPGSSIRKLW